MHKRIVLKLLTRLRLGPSHFNEHRFNHNFQSCINLLFSCSFAIESTSHFLLNYCQFSNICSTLLNSITEFLGSITNFSNYNFGTLRSQTNGRALIIGGRGAETLGKIK